MVFKKIINDPYKVVDEMVDGIVLAHHDILKFAKKKSLYIGDIAISYEIINFRSKKSNFNVEFNKVWIHGLLHLIGYNHIRNKDYFIMSKMEKKIFYSINQ